MTELVTVSFQLRRDDAEAMTKIAEDEKLPQETKANISRSYREAVQNFIKLKRSKRK